MSYLELRNVTKVIGPETVLDAVSFEVLRGQVVGLEGRNGSGKTMAMRVACGLIRPTEGVAVVDGKALWEEISFPPSVGLLIEAPALLGSYSARKNLELLASIRGVATAQDITRSLERVGLDPRDRRHVRKYSLGMKQRAGIAMALMEAPDLLVLDEPTNALDEGSRSELARIISEERGRGAAVLLSSHDSDFLRDTCDVIYHMELGRVTLREEVGRE